MQPVSPSFSQAAQARTRRPVQSLFVSWARQSAAGAFFTIGTSLIGGGDVVKGEGNNPAEASTYVYDDESAAVLSLETDRQLSEPVYSVALATADIVLSNVSGRYTPGQDPEIGAYIRPLRPLRASVGFDYGSAPEQVQAFTGQISEYPRTDAKKRTLTVTATDFLQAVLDYPMAATALYQNRLTSELVEAVLQQSGLSEDQYAVDRGTVTVPYAFFPAGTRAGDILKKLAEAEGAMLYADENGVIRFETRARWSLDPRKSRYYLFLQTLSGSGSRYWLPPYADVSPSTTYYFQDRYQSNVNTYVMVKEQNAGGTVTTTEIAAADAPSSQNEWRDSTVRSYTTRSDTVQMAVYREVRAPARLLTDRIVISASPHLAYPSLIPNFGAEEGTYAGTSSVPTGWALSGTWSGGSVGQWIDRGSPDPAWDIPDSAVLDEGQFYPEQRGTIVNAVEVTAKPRKVVSANETVYQTTANESRRVEAGASLEFWVSYADPVYSVVTPTAGGAQSHYAANAAADGSGADKTSQVTITSFTTFSQATKVTVHNADAGPVYLTDLTVAGKPAKVTQEIFVRAEDAASINEYGEQKYEIGNDFIQTAAGAQAIAAAIVADRKDPSSYLRLTVRAMPHLQLGDRVRRNGSDYFVIRILTRFTPSDGLTQELTVAKRPSYP